MSIRTTRFAVVALGLAAQLAGGSSSGQVLCLHHGAGVTLERAARGAVRCDDAKEPCVPDGLGLTPGENHCHDAAIAQPGIGRRVLTVTGNTLAAPGAHAVPALDVALAASVAARGIPHGSPPPTRRSVVLQV
jgi:hypothetical protein